MLVVSVAIGGSTENLGLVETNDPREEDREREEEGRKKEK